MKHDHWLIRVLAIMGLLAALAIGGGPVGFVLLVMASPLIFIMLFSARAVVLGNAGTSRTEHEQLDPEHAGAVKPDKDQ